MADDRAANLRQDRSREFVRTIPLQSKRLCQKFYREYPDPDRRLAFQTMILWVGARCDGRIA